MRELASSKCTGYADAADFIGRTAARAEDYRLYRQLGQYVFVEVFVSRAAVIVLMPELE